MKYRVDTHSWASEEFDSFDKALERYELTKDRLMGDGVTEDSYVELVSSDDDFEDAKFLKRAMVIVDEERMKINHPRDEGYDFDYWAKWEELIDDRTIHSK